jgi:hypothetical protein
MRTDEDDRTDALIAWENGEAQWVRPPPGWRVGQLDEQWFFPGRLCVSWSTRR